MKEISAIREVMHCTTKIKTCFGDYKLSSVALQKKATAFLVETGQSTILMLFHEETNIIVLNENLLPQIRI